MITVRDDLHGAAAATRPGTPADKPAASARPVTSAEHWQQGAMVGLVSVSLFALLLIGAVTIFSVLSTTLLTTDAFLVTAILILTGGLLALLARSQRVAVRGR